MKKVSVIIPAYNCEKYIENCIDSLVKQIYNNLQVIIVNDGSTDDTLKICKKISEENKNIVVLDKDNEGPSIARCYGLNYANGAYISFIDSDDYVDSDFYLKLVGYLEKEDADVAECGYKLVDEKNNIISWHKLSYAIINSNEQCVESYVKRINTTNFLCNKLYKKKVFNDVDFVKLYASEDACVLLQLFANCKRKVTISECMYNYVQTSTSLCRKPYNLLRNDIVDAGIFMYDFCKRKYSQFAIYYSAFICSYSAQCYANLKYSDILNRQEHMQYMENVFEKYYVKKAFNGLEISIFRKVLIMLFNFSPRISSYIYKKVLKK